MSLFSLRKKPAPEPAVNTPTPPKPASAAHPLDAVTGGAFSAPTSGERAARIREWLATEPAPDLMAEVYKELANRDRGAAKPLKERLDELKRLKTQEQVGAEWAARAEALLAASRLNLADALAWQRDAARAGAPLSREPLENALQQNGGSLPADHVETLSIHVITGYLQHSQAIGLLSQVVAQHYIQAGVLALLPLSLPDPQRPIGMTWSRHKPLTPALKTFMQCVRQSSARRILSSLFTAC